MKLFKLLVVVLITSACAFSAHAQKQLKYVPQTLKAAKGVYAANPHLSSLTRGNFAKGIASTKVSWAVERAVSAQVVTQTEVSPVLFGRDFRRLPQEWLRIIEPWVIKNKRWPSSNIEGEKALYYGASGVIRNHPKDPASIRLQELRKQWKKERADQTTPQEWFRILEMWVMEHKRWPSVGIEEEKAMYHGANSAIYNYPENPASIRLKKLKNQIKETEKAVDVNADAMKAAALGEKQLAFPGTVTTDEYVGQLLRFYNQLDPFGTGTIR